MFYPAHICGSGNCLAYDLEPSTSPFSVAFYLVIDALATRSVAVYTVTVSFLVVWFIRYLLPPRKSTTVLRQFPGSTHDILELSSRYEAQSILSSQGNGYPNTSYKTRTGRDVRMTKYSDAMSLPDPIIAQAIQPHEVPKLTQEKKVPRARGRPTKNANRSLERSFRNNPPSSIMSQSMLAKLPVAPVNPRPNFISGYFPPDPSLLRVGDLWTEDVALKKDLLDTAIARVEAALRENSRPFDHPTAPPKIASQPLNPVPSLPPRPSASASYTYGQAVSDPRSRLQV